MMGLSLKKYRYSFLAGACAAAASFLGKMPSFLANESLQKWSPSDDSVWSEYVYFYADLLLLRALPIALMVLCNVLNWRYFLKSLQMTEQTLTTTVLTSASNYAITIVLGICIYRESLTLYSFAGICLILAGLWFLSDEPDEVKLKK